MAARESPKKAGGTLRAGLKVARWQGEQNGEAVAEEWGSKSIQHGGG